ncbi:uncharacterized protein LOC144313251 [Canis aureus]
MVLQLPHTYFTPKKVMSSNNKVSRRWGKWCFLFFAPGSVDVSDQSFWTFGGKKQLNISLQQVSLKSICLEVPGMTVLLHEHCVTRTISRELRNWAESFTMKTTAAQRITQPLLD